MYSFIYGGIEEQWQCAWTFYSCTDQTTSFTCLMGCLNSTHISWESFRCRALYWVHGKCWLDFMLCQKYYLIFKFINLCFRTVLDPPCFLISRKPFNLFESQWALYTKIIPPPQLIILSYFEVIYMKALLTRGTHNAVYRGMIAWVLWSIWHLCSIHRYSEEMAHRLPPAHSSPPYHVLLSPGLSMN